MASHPTRCALVGMDDGSRLALQPLAAFASFVPVDADAANAADENYWIEIFRAGKFTGLVVGTSDSAGGRRVEASARRAAARCALPIAAIEDYPGNYSAVADAPVDILIAESRFSAQLYRERLGDACPRIEIFCSPRYDRYRVQASDLRRRTEAAWQQHDDLAILWAGQPEADDCIATLRRIAGAVREHNATLLFKAHPRDGSYAQGLYPRLFNELGIRCTDVTSLSVEASLALAPRLVVTQFSSVAVEAGFFGIPALHLVYHEVGGARLQQKKGFDVPPYCQAGAGFYLQGGGGESAALHSALFDEAARVSVITCFDDFFATRTEVAPGLAEFLVDCMG